MCSRAALAPANEAPADDHEGDAAGVPVAAKRKEPEPVASQMRPAGKKQKAPAPPGKIGRVKPQKKNSKGNKKKKSKKSSEKSSSEAESSASGTDHD